MNGHRAKDTGIRARTAPSSLAIFAAQALERAILARYSSGVRSPFRSASLETHGPLGTLWVGLGLGCFYIALVWLNTLLGFFLTPLFVIPVTWLTDKLGMQRATPRS